jgi:hypothetical protein
MLLMRVGSSSRLLVSQAAMRLFCFCREVDTFIEKLESTIAFLAGIEDGAVGTDDGFVPFI